MLNYKLSTSSWTHTHTTNVAHIYCVFTDKFFLKMQRASFLVSLSLSLFVALAAHSGCLSLSGASFRCCHRLTAAAMAFLCKTTVCCQQHSRQQPERERERGRGGEPVQFQRGQRTVSSLWHVIYHSAQSHIRNPNSIPIRCTASAL